jgi:hypothetical protein
MRLSRRIAVMLAAVTVLTLAPGADGIAGAPQTTAPDFQGRGGIPPGSTVEIKGVNGDVTADLAAGADVEVTARRRGRRSDPEEVRIEVVPHPGGVTICAVYPNRDADRPNECQPGEGGRMNVQNNDVTVTFAVRVPRGVRFVGRTVNGDVEARQMAGPVSLKTVNGSATFSTSSYGDASTVNGSVRASIGSADWTDALDFHSVNGTVTVDLPADVNTDVRASTVNGDISTDFPLTVTGRLGPRRITGTIGAGGRALEIDTVNGSVKLQKRSD